MMHCVIQETASSNGTTVQFQAYKQPAHVVKSLMYSMPYPAKHLALSPLDAMK